MNGIELKEDWTPKKRGFSALCKWLKQVSRLFNSLIVINGRFVFDGHHAVLECGSNAWTDWAPSLSGMDVTLNPGRVAIGSTVAKIDTATTITLSGATEWVFLQIARAAKTTVTVEHSSAEPTADSTYMRFLICKCTLRTDGTSYNMERDCRTSPTIDTPTR